MKKSIQILLYVLFLSSFCATFAQEWKYVGQVKFPAADSNIVVPYLCAMDSDGKLYVTSSKTTSVTAHNAIYYAAQNESTFTKLIDFTAINDTVTIGAIRGIATIGKSIFINANQNYAAVGTTVATIYHIPNGNVNNIEKFGYNITGAGYGTHIHGMALTKDTIAYCGLTFNTSIRLYNFNAAITTPARGSWVAINGTYPLEPGGIHTGGFDVVRDIALIPNGNYSSPETPFYTARNSLSATQVTGGIAVWKQGDQLNPGNYVGQRVTDIAGDLTFGTSIPYGIWVSNDSLLWVAGTDSLRKWVKAFRVTGTFAEQVYELPCLNSLTNPNPDGAPMVAPTDVIVSADGKTAFVTDSYTKAVYKFVFDNPNSVEGEVSTLTDFTLNQNYPNPFNPSTVISYNLPSSGSVKLVVTNSLGQKVAELVNEYQSSGKHSLEFNAASLSSGIYYYTLTTEAGQLSRKMMLVK